MIVGGKNMILKGEWITKPVTVTDGNGWVERNLHWTIPVPENFRKAQLPRIKKVLGEHIQNLRMIGFSDPKSGGGFLLFASPDGTPGDFVCDIVTGDFKWIDPTTGEPDTETPAIPERNTQMEVAITGNDKLPVTCYHCGHGYSTVVYRTPEGAIDTKKTQARCPKCKRRNGKQLTTPTPEPVTVTSDLTPVKPEVRIGDAPIPPKPVTVTPPAPAKVATPPTPTPTPAPVTVDWTPLLHILHAWESEYLQKTRGTGLPKEQIGMLDDTGNQVLTWLCQKYPGLATGPWLPVIMYAGAQAMILFGDKIRDAVSGAGKTEGVKQ